jgi:predicted O-methyltransferase YrrM
MAKMATGNNLPAIMTLFSQLYNEYRYKISSRIFNKITIKPWMKYREIQIVEEILKKLRPGRCLEWGAGYSTLYFPKVISEGSGWISVEHQKDWAEKTKKMNRKSNVEIFHISPNHFIGDKPFMEWGYSDLTDYIEFPDKFGNFDFILVDGAGRKDCLIKAYKLLKNGGVAVLHDANNTRYHEPLAMYESHVLFTDYRETAGGLWVGRKGLAIGGILNVDKHKNLWRVYNKIGRIGKMLRV